MIGSCHDALIGEWINWWLGQNRDRRICNPARQSRSRSRKHIADLLFLERFTGLDYYEVKGVAEIENSKSKFMNKIGSLRSYEDYTKRSRRVYPNLEFSVFCYTLDLPDDDLAEQIFEEIRGVSEDSSLLWIICEVGNSLRQKGEEVNDSIFMPYHVKDAECFYYYRRFSSVILYAIKGGRQVQEFTFSIARF